MTAQTANGYGLAFTVGDTVMVNGATVTTADVMTSNGIIHVIDKVLMPMDHPNDIPRTAQCTGVHDSLVAAVIQAELLETLQGEGPFTLFAPTDQALPTPALTSPPSTPSTARRNLRTSCCPTWSPEPFRRLTCPTA